MMNKKIKKLWLKSLRSGEYKQGKGRLRLDNNYCCLGVLCDLHKKENNSGWYTSCESELLYLGAKFTLPDDVVDWAELTDYSPMVKIGKKEVSLAKLNDGVVLNARRRKNKTFKQIANIIEKHL